MLSAAGALTLRMGRDRCGVLFLLCALFGEFPQREVLATREGKTYRYTAHKGDQPEQDSATHGHFGWDAVYNLKRAYDCKLASSSDSGQLHNRTDHAESHQQEHARDVQVAQVGTVANLLEALTLAQQPHFAAFLLNRVTLRSHPRCHIRDHIRGKLLSGQFRNSGELRSLHIEGRRCR